MPRPSITAALLLLTTGCAASRYACPDPEARAAWHQVRGAHLVLRTDLPPERAEALARALERAWEVHDAVSGKAPPDDRPLVLHVLRDAGALWPEGERPTLSGEDAARHGFVVEPADAAVLARGTHPALRALAHLRLARALPGGPEWLVAGLTDFLGTLAPQPGGEVRLGLPLAPHLRALQARPPLGLEALWAGEAAAPAPLPAPATAEDSAHVAASRWLWVHHLALAHGDRFTVFQRALRELPPRDAWALAFAGVAPATLEAGVRAHVAVAARAVTYREPTGPTTFELRALEPADVHLVHAALRDAQQVGALLRDLALGRLGEAGTFVVTLDAQRDALLLLERARAEREAALEADPAHPLARAEHLAQREDRPTRSEVAALLRLLHAGPDVPPEAWTAALAVLARTGAPAEQVAPLVRELAAREVGSEALRRAAAWLLAHGEPGPAHALAARAHTLRPLDAAVLDTLASTLAATGRCAEARTAQEQALLLQTAPASLVVRGERGGANVLTPTGAGGPRARLEHYRAGCPDGPPPAQP